jgi:hypothetical protein
MKHIKEFNEFINESKWVRGSKSALDDILKQRKIVQYIKRNPAEDEVAKKSYGLLATLYDKQETAVWMDIDSRILSLGNKAYNTYEPHVLARVEARSNDLIAAAISASDTARLRYDKMLTKYSTSLLLPILALAAEGGGVADSIAQLEYRLKDKDKTARKPELQDALDNEYFKAQEVVKTNKDRLDSIDRDINNRIDSL